MSFEYSLSNLDEVDFFSGPSGTLCMECASVEPHDEHLEDEISSYCNKCQTELSGSTCCPPGVLCEKCGYTYNTCYQCGKQHPSPAKSARK